MNKMMTAMVAILLATGLNAAETPSTTTEAKEATPWHDKGVMLVLPDGTEVSKMEVVGVLSTMRAIEQRNPNAAASIVKRAGAPDMPLSPGLMEHLVKAGLVNEDGTFPENIQEILKTFLRIDDQGHVAPVVPGEEEQVEEPVPTNIE